MCPGVCGGRRARRGVRGFEVRVTRFDVAFELGGCATTKENLYRSAAQHAAQHQLTQPAKIEWAYKNIMLQAFAGASAWLAERTGVEGALGYAVVVGLAIIGHFVMNHVDNQRYEAAAREAEAKKAEEEAEEPEPPRNFTQTQLLHFDGTRDERLGDDKPIYLSLNGTVFDCSKGRDFYGPGGPYAMFAGHECGVSLAKMDFDKTYIDDLAGVAKLNFGEKNTLDEWIEKFTHFKPYPKMGRLVTDDMLPSSDRVLSLEDLAKNDGTGAIPGGYATAPIYLGVAGKVFDVSFGGIGFYGAGGGYNRFAGKDASRALAKMSFDPADTADPDVSNLTEKERKVLGDWVKTFEEKKNYPCVGRLK